MIYSLHHDLIYTPYFLVFPLQMSLPSVMILGFLTFSPLFTINAELRKRVALVIVLPRRHQVLTVQMKRGLPRTSLRLASALGPKKAAKYFLFTKFSIKSKGNTRGLNSTYSCNSPRMISLSLVSGRRPALLPNESESDVS